MKESLLVRASRGERTERPPVWFMRQAGRSLPEYRKVREGVPMLESCQRPDMVIEITMQPVRRYGVDAAILFSDIVVPLKAAGVDVEIQPGVGPVVAAPIRDAAGVNRLRPLDAGDVAFVAEAVRGLVTELGPTPLIGFAGAPFTLASYLVEGGPSRHHERTKALMHSEPEVWSALLSRVAAITSSFLQVQIDAGVSVIQLFDSWAGALSESDYRRHVMPHSAAVLAGVDSVPRIHFGVGTSEFLPLIAQAGAEVVGVDWRLPLDEAARRVPGKALQGNLDPAILFADWAVIESEVDRIVAEGRTAPGHIFNLGHGVLPTTDPGVLARVVERVQAAGGAEG